MDNLMGDEKLVKEVRELSERDVVYTMELLRNVEKKEAWQIRCMILACATVLEKRATDRRSLS